MESQLNSPMVGLFLVFGIAGGIFLALVLGLAFWMILRHAQKGRELLHTERMKALEVGQPLGFTEHEKLQQEQAHNTFWIAFWVGAGVPIAAVWAAAYSIVQGNLRELAVTLVVWISVAVICVASTICATLLMVNARRVPPQNEKNSS